ncbi:30S ribosomal protein THX [Robertkochia aurantiaca]|nr:30S ribosomal protein THX [Robertkochia sp. 3YJGBD-33]
MGKGDIKSRRGKIYRGTYGVRRRRKIKKKAPVEEKLSIDTKK